MHKRDRKLSASGHAVWTLEVKWDKTNANDCLPSEFCLFFLNKTSIKVRLIEDDLIVERELRRRLSCRDLKDYYIKRGLEVRQLNSGLDTTSVTWFSGIICKWGKQPVVTRLGVMTASNERRQYRINHAQSASWHTYTTTMYRHGTSGDVQCQCIRSCLPTDQTCSNRHRHRSQPFRGRAGGR